MLCENVLWPYGPNLGFKFKVFAGLLALREGSMARILVSSLQFSQVCLLCETFYGPMAPIWVSSLRFSQVCLLCENIPWPYGPNLGFKFKVFAGLLALREGSMARIWVSSLRFSQVCWLCENVLWLYGPNLGFKFKVFAGLLCEKVLWPESGFQVHGFPRSACSAKTFYGPMARAGFQI